MRTIKKTIIILVAIFISTSPMLAQGTIEGKSEFPVLKGPYLGQKPPGLTAEIFAPGIRKRGQAT